MTSCCHYLGVHLTSLFSFFLTLAPFICVDLLLKRYNGWGVTLFDSLSTMWVMGLRDEFTEAVDSIRDLQFHATNVKPNPSFVITSSFNLYSYSLITLRLFSKLQFVTWEAHSLPMHFPEIQLSFVTLTESVKSSFQLSTVPNRDFLILMLTLKRMSFGLKSRSCHLFLHFFQKKHSGEIPHPSQKTILFAEAATCQLEFKFLAKLTGNREYYDKVRFLMTLYPHRLIN